MFMNTYYGTWTQILFLDKFTSKMFGWYMFRYHVCGVTRHHKLEWGFIIINLILCVLFLCLFSLKVYLLGIFLCLHVEIIRYLE